MSDTCSICARPRIDCARTPACLATNGPDFAKTHAPPSQPGPQQVEIRPAKAPDGRLRVLLQFEHGYLLVPPEEARRLGAWLWTVADEVEGRNR